MCERLVLYQPVLSDASEIRSLRLVLAEKQTLYQTVLSETPEIRSLKLRLDRGEARALSCSKECQSLWLYLPINNHHASIPAQGIAASSVRIRAEGRQATPSLVTGLDDIKQINKHTVITPVRCLFNIKFVSKWTSPLDAAAGRHRVRESVVYWYSI